MEPVDAQPPKTIEQIAMDKVIDPFSEPYPLWHHTHVSKLRSILKTGLVAENFAKKVGIPIRRIFTSSWNEKYVSLRLGGEKGSGARLPTHVSILVDPKDEVVEATESHATGEDFKPTKHEYLVANRIAPREIVGLQIHRGIDDLPRNYDIKVEEIIDLFMELGLSASVPIYGTDGLIWPVRMTREQLRDRVQSQA